MKEVWPTGRESSGKVRGVQFRFNHLNARQGGQAVERRLRKGETSQALRLSGWQEGCHRLFVAGVDWAGQQACALEAKTAGEEVPQEVVRGEGNCWTDARVRASIPGGTRLRGL